MSEQCERCGSAEGGEEMTSSREKQFERIFAAEYEAADPTTETGAKKGGEKSIDNIKRRIAIRKLAAVCHDRRVIARISGVRLANVKTWLGDDTSSWPKESEKGCT